MILSFSSRRSLFYEFHPPPQILGPALRDDGRAPGAGGEFSSFGCRLAVEALPFTAVPLWLWLRLWLCVPAMPSRPHTRVKANGHPTNTPSQHVGVTANVVDVRTGKEETTNEFRFTWSREDGAPLNRTVVPRTYGGAGLFLTRSSFLHCFFS